MIDKDLEQAINKQQYDFYTKERKNFSKEADELMDEIKKGYKPSDYEVFILLTPQEWLEEHKDQVELKKELDRIKEQAKCGSITPRDFNLLAEIIHLTEEEKEVLAKNFYAQGKIKEEEIKKEH